MRVLFFGTFDERSHPRVRALRESFEARGHDVTQVNAPLGLSTAQRVGILRRPYRAPVLAWRLLRCWMALWRGSAGLSADVVVVGYLGHFDVHLARRRFPRTVVVLDHMVSLGDTARDRGSSDGSVTTRLLDAIDRAALRAADVVVVDTEQQGEALPIAPKRLCAVSVTAPRSWSSVVPAPAPSAEDPVRVVFFGLFTPLQGAPVIGEALALLAGHERIRATMIGTGQDLDETCRRAAANPRIEWLDWVDPTDLPEVVASHHVCLGIFGTTPKALRVVPNKVLQGGAAGCALITSDTPAQREALGGAARYVPPGSAEDLARALSELVGDPELLARHRRAALRRLREERTSAEALAPLERILRASLEAEVGR